MERSLLSTIALTLLVSAAGVSANSNASLLDAARGNDIARTRSLLAAGTDVNTRDANGTTALMIAAACGYPDLAELLLLNNADVRARGYIGNTALIYATQEGHADIARMLVAQGAAPTARNEFGNSATALAAGLGQHDVAATFDSNPSAAPSVSSDIVGQLAELLLMAIAVVGIPAVTACTLYGSLAHHHSHPAH